MPTSWRDSADSLDEILRRHGVDPEAVTDVEAAWRAFILGTTLGGALSTGLVWYLGLVPTA
jgi:hypothetical protein